jgi:DNA-binding MarR family transcriptional regulator
MKKTSSTAALDLTPRGRLDEGAMHDLLGYLVAQASVVTRRHFEREVGKTMGLRPVEFTVLQLVRQNNEVTPTRLSQALDVSTPAITVYLDRLERRGLLMRARSAVDGRAQHVRLTPEGVSLVSQALDTLLTTQQRLMAHLSLGERTLFMELLRKIGHAPKA